VAEDVIERARRGNWAVSLSGYDPVDPSWFPSPLAGTDVLCLAGGGGQQGPVLAGAGALVTVFDNSPAQLARDRMVAEREGLDLATVLGDMRDLGVFESSSFDLIFQPVSNLFCPELAPVWRECFRVLRPGGILLVGFNNPDVYLFDAKILEDRRELVVRHSLPYSDLTHLSPEEHASAFGAESAYEYSHSLAEQIGGQLAAGFVLTGFAEGPHHSDATADYLFAYLSTRAVKPS